MSAPKKVIRCHYEVLEIERTATNDEIRASYKQLARKWHPDKNLDDPVLAAERFKEVQQAYEVLSDSNERSWYDSHREAILRGVNPNEAEGTVDLVNVFPYFSTTCYSGFSDEKPGFYGVYREVFGEINKKEQEMGESPQDWPAFGNSSTPWEDVADFYRHWSNYVTALSFGWSETYHVTAQINRRVRRLMDKENKKGREGAKKEFVDSIRKLVAFVKKRDPRVIEHNKIEEQKQAEKLQRQKELKLKQQQERREHIEKLLKERELEEEDSEDDFDDDEEDSELSDENEDQESQENNTNAQEEAQDKEDDAEPEEDEELDELYCYACKKRFKSDKQKLNHEQSKKHKETVAKMRKEVMLDDEEPMNGGEVSSPDIPASKNSKQNKKNQKGKKGNQAQPQQKQEAKPKPAPVEEKPKPAPKVQVPPVTKVEKSESESEEDEDENEDDYVLRSMMQRVQVSSKQNKKNKKQQQQARMLREMGAEFDKVNEAIDARVKSQDDDDSSDDDEADKPQEVTKPVVDEKSNNNNTDESAGGAKKKKRRRAVKDKTGTAAPVPTPAPAPNTNNKKAAKDQDKTDEEFTCKVCNEEFLTRNALFTHIKKTKHAAPKE